MAGQIYVPGPAEIFTGTGASKAFEFLGTTVDGVNVNFRGNWSGVFGDVIGPLTPADRQYFPESADFTARMLHYNEGVLSRFKARIAGGTFGALASNTAGSLLVAQNLGIPVVIRAPYAFTVPAFAGMISGFSFPVAFIDDNIDPFSVVRKTPEIAVGTQWVVDYTNYSAALFSTVLPSLPAVG